MATSPLQQTLAQGRQLLQQYGINSGGSSELLPGISQYAPKPAQQTQQELLPGIGQYAPQQQQQAQQPSYWDAWDQQTVGQYTNGFNPLEIQATDSVNPRGYTQGGSTSMNIGRAAIIQSVYDQDRNGQTYYDNDAGWGKYEIPSVADTIAMYDDRRQLSGMPVSYEQLAQAAQYVKDKNDGSWIDLNGRVVTPGTKVWNADRSGYYTYDPSSLVEQYKITEDPVAKAKAYNPETGWGDYTPQYMRIPTDAVLQDPSYLGMSAAYQLIHPLYDESSWKYTSAAGEEGAYRAPQDIWNTLYGAGMLAPEEWTGSMGQGAINAIRGIVSVAAPMLTMGADSVASQLGSSIGQGLSSAGINSTVAGVAGNALGYGAIGGAMGGLTGGETGALTGGLGGMVGSFLPSAISSLTDAGFDRPIAQALANITAKVGTAGITSAVSGGDPGAAAMRSAASSGINEGMKALISSFGG